MRQTYICVCEQCGKSFTARSLKAKTCSNACRIAKYRDGKRGNGKSWHYVRAEYASKAQEIKSISETAYNAIYGLLEQYGAIATEYAIAAAYEAVKATLDKVSEHD